MPDPENRFTVYINCEGEPFQEPDKFFLFPDPIHTDQGKAYVNHFDQ